MALQRALGVGQRTVAEIADHGGGADRDRGDQKRAAQHQPLDRTAVKSGSGSRAHAGGRRWRIAVGATPQKVPHHPLQEAHRYRARVEGGLRILVGKWLI